MDREVLGEERALQLASGSPPCGSAVSGEAEVADVDVEGPVAFVGGLQLHEVPASVHLLFLLVLDRDVVSETVVAEKCRQSFMMTSMVWTEGDLDLCFPPAEGGEGVGTGRIVLLARVGRPDSWNLVGVLEDAVRFETLFPLVSGV